MPFVMLMYDLCDDVIWPAMLLEKIKEFPAFGKWTDVGLQHESVLDKVAREPRKAAILRRLPEVKQKYAN